MRAEIFLKSVTFTDIYIKYLEEGQAHSYSINTFLVNYLILRAITGKICLMEMPYL